MGACQCKTSKELSDDSSESTGKRRRRSESGRSNNSKSKSLEIYVQDTSDSDQKVLVTQGTLVFPNGKHCVRQPANLSTSRSSDSNRSAENRALQHQARQHQTSTSRSSRWGLERSTNRSTNRSTRENGGGSIPLDVDLPQQSMSPPHDPILFDPIVSPMSLKRSLQLNKLAVAKDLKGQQDMRTEKEATSASSSMIGLRHRRSQYNQESSLSRGRSILSRSGKSAKKSKSGRGRSRNRALLVEDVQVTQRLNVVQMYKAGYETETASSGLAAVRMATEGYWDVILMDIELGDNYGGVMATQAIRNFELENGIEPTLILAFTSHCSFDHLIRFDEAGMNGCLEKGCLLSKILPEAVRTLLANPLFIYVDGNNKAQNGALADGGDLEPVTLRRSKSSKASGLKTSTAGAVGSRSSFSEKRKLTSVNRDASERDREREREHRGMQRDYSGTHRSNSNSKNNSKNSKNAGSGSGDSGAENIRHSSQQSSPRNSRVPASGVTAEYRDLMSSLAKFADLSPTDLSDINLTDAEAVTQQISLLRRIARHVNNPNSTNGTSSGCKVHAGGTSRRDGKGQHVGFVGPSCRSVVTPPRSPLSSPANKDPGDTSNLRALHNKPSLQEKEDPKDPKEE